MIFEKMPVLGIFSVLSCVGVRLVRWGLVSHRFNQTDGSLRLDPVHGEDAGTIDNEGTRQTEAFG
jgi:hypothetical protein